MGRTFGVAWGLAVGALAGLCLIAPGTAAAASKDRTRLDDFQTSLTAAADQLAAADKAYLGAVRAALQSGNLSQADQALARFDQQVTLAARAAPATPAFSGCAAAKTGADKARVAVVHAGTGRRQRVQRLRQLGASRTLSIADYYSVSPSGAPAPAEAIKPGMAEASAALSRCEAPPRRGSKRANS